MKRAPFLLLPLLVLAHPAAAQVGLVTETRIRIVVHQFVSQPDDSAQRALASQVARSLVLQLTRDPAFLVMGGTRDNTRPGSDAQYAIIGVLTGAPGSQRIDLRLLDINKVELVARESWPLAGAPLQLALASVVQQMAGKIHEHLTRRHWGGATSR